MSDPYLRPYFISSIVNIPLYFCILCLVELLQTKIAALWAERNFRKHVMSIPAAEILQEAVTLAEEAQDPSKDFAIRVRGVSRVFIDERGKPIMAVNNVSIGVRQGSLFGFLGANGAGKTTLMKMLVGEIPPSSGLINVDGDIAICPQFNTHLTNEMTIDEHFALFSLLHGLPHKEADDIQGRLVSELLLGDHVSKPVKKLSGGNARKLAIAMALFSPARIVLLDEPTSSLDPLARHAAQRVIASFRGEKTMMLCTHLLSEAEELCDTISIMLKGSVYVVGSPAYLSAKFGTEWRLDVLFNAPTNGQFFTFLTSEVPSAKLIIPRPTNEIYSIPSSAIPMVQLFEIMDRAIAMRELCVKFFTASSATLDKVFMELVMQSEADPEVARDSFKMSVV
jgi:ABC-type multidrug transport system ATPase subunit